MRQKLITWPGLGPLLMGMLLLSYSQVGIAKDEHPADAHGHAVAEKTPTAQDPHKQAADHAKDAHAADTHGKDVPQAAAPKATSDPKAAGHEAAAPATASHGNKDTHRAGPASDKDIQEQRLALERNTRDKGFGPQSPRDITAAGGSNKVSFATAPVYTKMNLCNIHFHKNAEHKGPEFNRYAGNGDGHGFETGFLYSGTLSPAELKPLGYAACASEHGELKPGDTIELHYVHSTAAVKPGPTLGACLSEAVKNPQLRVEAQVMVLVNDTRAVDFGFLTDFGIINGFHQAINIPANTGTPIAYAGSTTGPSFNEQGSPLQVSWNVRPKVVKVNLHSLASWCKQNAFKEDHAHGVRNLVTAPELLSPISR